MNQKKNKLKAVVAITVALAFVLPGSAVVVNIETIGDISNSEQTVDIKNIVESWMDTRLRTGGIIYVGGTGTGNYTSIQGGINAAEPGDTVYVYNGTYTEQIIINIQLALIGEDKNITIIDGNNSGDVIFVSSEGVTISGFTVQNSGLGDIDSGIKLFSSNNNTIMDNIISNNPLGIRLQSSSNTAIMGNNVLNNEFGIALVSSSNNNIITGNNALNNYISIAIASTSSNNTVTSNNIHSSSLYGIYMVSSSNNNITGNNASNNGISIGLATSSNNNIITGNNASSSSNNGIYIIFSSNNIITGNNANSNGYNGIYLSGSNNNIITENNVNSNTFSGIIQWESFGNNITGNNANSNGEGGIELYCESSNNIIMYNNVSLNDNSGISMIDCSNNNIVMGNNVNSNNPYGIAIFEDSNNNMIYHNNLINNIQNAYDQCSNTWDDGYPSGGNYWSDYTGTDDDGDGIGDTPYTIPGGSNQDYYPFMEPNGWESSPPNQPPNKPNKPSGPAAGYINSAYTYSTNTTDPDGDQVYYLWDWGDGTQSEWIGPLNSGETIETTNQWTVKGSYEIKVKAKDIFDTESSWSDALHVTIEEIKEPILIIGDITGGIGVSTVVRNIGSGDATNIDWTITLDGYLIFFGKSSEGTEETIIAGNEAVIRADFILGIGKTNIKVTATCDEGKTVERTASAFVFGPFVLGVKTTT